MTTPIGIQNTDSEETTNNNNNNLINELAKESFNRVRVLQEKVVHVYKMLNGTSFHSLTDSPVVKVPIVCTNMVLLSDQRGLIGMYGFHIELATFVLVVVDVNRCEIVKLIDMEQVLSVPLDYISIQIDAVPDTSSDKIVIYSDQWTCWYIVNYEMERVERSFSFGHPVTRVLFVSEACHITCTRKELIIVDQSQLNKGGQIIYSIDSYSIRDVAFYSSSLFLVQECGTLLHLNLVTGTLYDPKDFCIDSRARICRLFLIDSNRMVLMCEDKRLYELQIHSMKLKYIGKSPALSTTVISPNAVLITHQPYTIEAECDEVEYEMRVDLLSPEWLYLELPIPSVTPVMCSNGDLYYYNHGLCHIKLPLYSRSLHMQQRLYKTCLKQFSDVDIVTLQQRSDKE